jgi:hypothetical protein
MYFNLCFHEDSSFPTLNKNLTCIIYEYCMNIPSSKENIPICKTAMPKSYDPAPEVICMLFINAEVEGYFQSMQHFHQKHLVQNQLNQLIGKRPPALIT